MLLDWLCVHAGGTFVPNPAKAIKSSHMEYVEQTQTMIHDFAESFVMACEQGHFD